jgi:hypothetical protein
MSISHAVRKERRLKVFKKVIEHVLKKNKVIKINDLYDIFKSDVFTNKSYFIRQITIMSEEDDRVHTKSAQRAGSYIAPINILFSEPEKKLKKSNKNKIHKSNVTLPSSEELFGNENINNDYTEERYFCNEEGIDYEGKQTDIDIDIDKKWKKINKKLFHRVGYTDTIEAYEYTENDITEYLIITSEKLKFHFVQE